MVRGSLSQGSLNPGSFSHLDEQGRVKMVDTSGKKSTARRAVARGQVSFLSETLDSIRRKAIGKGEVLAVSRIAGIQAAKETARLIPLCHSLPLNFVGVEFSFPDSLSENRGLIEIRATAATEAQTGVEMEALTAVSIAALTLYDMCKGIDKTIRIESIELLEKTGGKSDIAPSSPREKTD